MAQFIRVASTADLAPGEAKYVEAAGKKDRRAARGDRGSVRLNVRLRTSTFPGCRSYRHRHPAEDAYFSQFP